ncbi:MAG: cell envelope integrity protein TolA [Dongiaceae bacterium]
MGKGAIYSAVLHLVIVLLAVFGLPWLFDSDEIIEATPVSMVSADQLNELLREAKEQPKEKPPEPPEPPKPEEAKIPEPPAPAPEPEPEPIAEPEIAEVVPVPEPVIAEPVPEPPPPEPLPVEEPQKIAVAKPVPPQKPKPPKKDKKKPEDKAKEEATDSMSALLNKLSTQQSATLPEPSAEDTEPQQTAIQVQLTFGEENAIRDYIHGCWFSDNGKPGFVDMVATIQIDVNPDGSVRQAEVAPMDRLRMQSDAFFRAFVEDARRAVLKCDRLPMPQSQRYQDVSRINLRFSGRDY